MSDNRDDSPGQFTLREQIGCVRAEIHFRETTYPRWIQASNFSQANADREIACMKAVLKTLQALINDGR